MLKSTHKPVAVASNPVLPEGWTEHTAPTGHTYYYNASTKTSTYQRPQKPAPDAAHTPQQSYGQAQPQFNLPHTVNGQSQQYSSFDRDASAPFTFNGNRSSHPPRAQPRDRPKTKVAIPGSEPWVLVTTKLGRRFVHNPQTRESFWRFPPDILKNVTEMDRESREKRQKTDHKPSNQVPTVPAPPAATSTVADNTNEADAELASDEEYEEVEVTDDGEDDEPSQPAREEPAGDRPVEFDEDDIAYQLQAMGQEYGLEPDEYGIDDNMEIEDGAEGLPLTEDDAKALFKDLLDDFQVSPFTTWDALIEAGHIIDDDRYVALPNMRSRKEAWTEWSKDKTQEIKEKRALEAKKDPKIPYFEFLETRATPKLYWPEFRRKFQKEPELRNAKIGDKDREKWYREYINRLKLPEQTLKTDFIALLKSQPLYSLNKSTTLESLPSTMVTDLRFISLRPAVRNPLIEAHTRTLGPAPTNPELSAEKAQQRSKDRSERERREQALADRQRLVEQKKKEQDGALRYGKGMLREGEDQLERARRVNKQGLLGHLDNDEDS